MSQQQPQVPQQAQVDTATINVANFLRDNSILKQRSGVLQGKGAADFFKFKRASRALLSDEYKTKASNPKNQLPRIDTEDQAKQVFALLIRAQLVIPGQKLHTHEAREKNLNPKKGSPVFLPLQRAELTPGEYYIWLYKKKSIRELALGLSIVGGVFTLILFPLWPLFMRQGVVYLAQFVLGLFGLLIVIAIARLILYLLSTIGSRGFWLFPNLFADVGFFDSFKPLYEWEQKKEKKGKKGKKEKADIQSPLPAKGSTSSSKPNESSTIKRKVTLEEIDD